MNRHPLWARLVYAGIAILIILLLQWEGWSW